jgi:hypothetical protein
MLAAIVYLLCAVTSLACSVMLFRAYRSNGMRLLLWSSVCFICIVINNIFLVIDLLLVPDIDFSVVRLLSMLIGLGILIYGLIWEAN